VSETRLTDDQVGALLDPDQSLQVVDTVDGGYEIWFDDGDPDLDPMEVLRSALREIQSSRQRRCDGCGFWQTGGVAEGYGECGASTLLVFGDSVVTRGDFGCTQFTPKEAL
jgi:hypothetical protein